MFAPQPFIYWSGKRISSFKIFGALGVIVSLITTFYLTRFLHLSLLVWLIMAVIGMAAFFGLAEVMNRIKGEPVLVYYHHEFAIVLICTCFLLFTDSPHLLPFLDITSTGLGIVLIFGRIGCFMAGCCHGKPSSFGIHYHKEHAEMGFPYYYLNTRLFPVQIIEASGVALIVIFMILSIMLQAPPGTAFAIYILSYGLLRFFLEFARGDISRPYYGPFSEAQWFSVVLCLIILILSFFGWFPGFIWHVAVITLFCGFVAFLFLIRKLNNPWLQIKHYQIRKLALLINEMDTENSGELRMSIGENTILVTAGIVEEENMRTKHFTVSMYPKVKGYWLDFICNLIYTLQNRSGELTKVNKSASMSHLIMKFQKDTLIPKVIKNF